MKEALIAFILALYGCSDTHTQDAEKKHYCEMVQEFERSQGEYGWPAYKGTEQCQEKN